MKEIILLKCQQFKFKRNTAAQLEILNCLEDYTIEYRAFDTSIFKICRMIMCIFHLLCNFCMTNLLQAQDGIL